MKKYLFVISILLFINNFSFATSINPVAYRANQIQAYQQNLHRQRQQTRQIPYWQAQSNYSTRNRVYTNYSNYVNNQSNYNQYYRGQ